MLTIDAHLDLAFNATTFGRDLTRSAREIRRYEAGQPSPVGQATVGLPDLVAGEVAVSVATLLALPPRGPMADVVPGFRTPQEAEAITLAQLAYYRRLSEAGQIRLIGDRAALESHWAEWTKPGGQRLPGLVLSMEGADPIVSPGDLGLWWERGLRAIGPAWYGPGRYAHGTRSPGPLTAEGRDLLAAMAEVGMILDVSHLAEEAFFQALDLFPGVILASHSNCRALVPGDRQLSDEMIRALVARDGVTGAVCDAWMLYPGWIKGETSNRVVSLATVADHIDHVCQIAGDVRHAALGTDLDGGYGYEQSPHDLETIADVQKIPGILRGRGYAEDDVAAIMHGNWLRLLRRAWGER
ncbi:MAG: membrane dipeptidase [Anaerolineae bacterium]|nr:membrane dipeptidase [Anaerolineae bacterium]